MFDAFHLPTALDSDIDGFEVFATGGAQWRVPRLLPHALRRIGQSLQRNRNDILARRPLASIIAAIDHVARRLIDETDPIRHEADELLPGVTGYSPAMIKITLDHMARDWCTPALERLIHAELRHPGALDAFVLDVSRGTRVHASGPALMVHILSGNVPGVAVTSLVRALLVKSASLAKTASREPVLAPLFARALAEFDADLGRCLAVMYWRSGDVAAERAATAHADAVMFYGGAEAAREIRGRLDSAVTLIEHGPRVSFGIVMRESLNDRDAARALASAVARATALFDQQGCVSPQLVYVETGAPVSPKEFAALVANALEEVAHTLPRGPLSPAEAAAIHELRASAEFRSIAGENVDVFASVDTSATVIFETDAAFAGSPLNRVLRVKAVADADLIPGLLGPARHLLQTAALSGPSARIEALAPRLVARGVTRITSFDRMPFPLPFWHQDGRGPLGELLRWADLELL